MSKQSLHDDLGLHEFSEMQAKLADGRLVRVSIDEDGHIRIMALLGDGELSPGSFLPGTVTINQAGTQVQVSAEQMRQIVEEMQQQVRDGKTPNIPPTPIPGTAQMPSGLLPGSYGPPPSSSASSPATMGDAGSAAGPGALSPAPQPQNSPNATQSINTQGQSQSVQELMRPAGVGMMPVPSTMLSNRVASYGLGVGGSDTSEEVTDNKSGQYTYIPRDNVFQARLESIMNDNQFDRRLTGRTRGKLDMKRLYKAQSGATNLFTQKTMRRNRKYNIVIVVDESGSMYNATGTDSRIYQAGLTCQFLAEHFNRLPGINLAVVGFSDYTTVHKQFNERLKLDELLYKIKHSPVNGHGTNDWAGLQRGYKLLVAQNKVETTKSHNILVFITDGGSSLRSRVTEVRNQYKAVDATQVGIGIFGDAPQMDHSIRINNIRDLKPEIVKVLRGEIKRG